MDTLWNVRDQMNPQDRGGMAAPPDVRGAGVEGRRNGKSSRADSAAGIHGIVGKTGENPRFPAAGRGEGFEQRFGKG